MTLTIRCECSLGAGASGEEEKKPFDVINGMLMYFGDSVIM